MLLLVLLLLLLLLLLLRVMQMLHRQAWTEQATAHCWHRQGRRRGSAHAQHASTRARRTRFQSCILTRAAACARGNSRARHGTLSERCSRRCAVCCRGEQLGLRGSSDGGLDRPPLQDRRQAEVRYLKERLALPHRFRGTQRSNRNRSIDGRLSWRHNGRRRRYSMIGRHRRSSHVYNRAGGRVAVVAEQERKQRLSFAAAGGRRNRCQRAIQLTSSLSLKTGPAACTTLPAAAADAIRRGAAATPVPLQRRGLWVHQQQILGLQVSVYHTLSMQERNPLQQLPKKCACVRLRHARINGDALKQGAARRHLQHEEQAALRALGELGNFVQGQYVGVPPRQRAHRGNLAVQPAPLRQEVEELAGQARDGHLDVPDQHRTFPASHTATDT
jgi:hypothetical protein